MISTMCLIFPEPIVAPTPVPFTETGMPNCTDCAPPVVEAEIVTVHVPEFVPATVNVTAAPGEAGIAELGETEHAGPFEAEEMLLVHCAICALTGAVCTGCSKFSVKVFGERLSGVTSEVPEGTPGRLAVIVASESVVPL